MTRLAYDLPLALWLGPPLAVAVLVLLARARSPAGAVAPGGSWR